MGYKAQKQYVLPIIMSSLSPADATIYYFTQSTSGADVNEATYRMYIPITGIITGLDLQHAYSAAVTNETFDIKIRINETTDYTVISATHLNNPSPTRMTVRNLNIPVSYGDIISVKILFPTWATNPTSMRTTGQFIIDFD